jgi:hypothetical protein
MANIKFSGQVLVKNANQTSHSYKNADVPRVIHYLSKLAQDLQSHRKNNNRFSAAAKEIPTALRQLWCQTYRKARYKVVISYN